MELTKIKMAGFKSFVDPVTITFPAQWNCIVGPNGCGKSNTIDAVRCVMGESAAKQLRGGGMEDMIFSGCATRKPVAQASIELTFDNSDGSLGGPYAAYSEIAVKRSVNRDGQSNYYLNGTRCRRRDIADVFLGTGLGPRSYSIIEQGTISRVVEAKPMELRAYLEEAAGVSKYKERRRETENRIKHTRENIERVADLCAELDKQQSHLKRQASAAERYQVLTAELRLSQAQSHALNWKILNTESNEQKLVIEQQETQLAQYQANEQHAETHLTELDVEFSDKQESFNQKQAKMYQCMAEINKHEQAIEHIRQQQAKRDEELTQIDESLTENQSHLGDDQSRYNSLVAEKEEVQPALLQIRSQHEQASESLRVAEISARETQARWEENQQLYAKSERQAQMSAQTIEHKDAQINQCEYRIEEIQAELANTNQEQESIDISELAECVATKDQQLHQKQETLAQVKANMNETKFAIEDQRQLLDNKIQLKQQYHADLTALKALQKTALGKHQEGLNAWLERQALANQPRLGESLDVDPKWAAAVETVLNYDLDAVCVESLESIVNTIHQWPEQSVTLYSAASSKQAASPQQHPRLAATIQSGQAHPALQAVLQAEDLASALQLLPQISEHESIITPEGVWLSQQWLKIIRKDDSQAGILPREQKIKETQLLFDEILIEIEHLHVEINNQKTQMTSWQEQYESLQLTCQEISQALAELKGDLRAQQAMIEESVRRQDKLNCTLEEQRELLRLARVAKEEQIDLLEEAKCQLAQAQADKQQLSSERESSQSMLADCRQRAMSLRDELHDLEMRWRTVETELGSLSQAQSRLVGQIERLQLQRESLLAETETQPRSADSMLLSLESALNDRLRADEEFQQAKSLMEEHDHRKREYDHQRQEARVGIERIRTKLEQLRLDMQTLTVKQANLMEQFADNDFDFDEILQQLPQEVTLQALIKQIQECERQIDRLGAINLAAIDEYKTVSERKEYLDAQTADLEKALETLESAIRKIDQETRVKLRETFEKINGKFQTLFPKVFGGGQASLILTEQDWLTTGISIMARPPGKRNASIHMLSGGEKALTAVAFVFAIFHLNPAPFCMLDEVDAPLDDANVERFCRLVEEMSKTVKFVIISHNKLTISKANNLIGVTMKEPGVSRTVQVDVEEAVQLAGA